jgi:hypothetical protein
VQNAVGIKINGTKRIDCEHCSLTHAESRVSRRPPSNPAPRPFWRIHWDLFDYPEGIEGALWLLIIKDEWSDAYFVKALQNKTLTSILEAIRNFESFVRRHYKLLICRIRQDNDTATIARKDGTLSSIALTRYEKWAEEMGIILEPTPSYTHEPNGTAERAGKEIITKALKMRIAAGLPTHLYPEIAKAAVFLRNMSPIEKHAMISPLEKINLWFQQWYRWYSPEIVKQYGAEKRPNWEGIYSYGCRAYALEKPREAGRDRRAYKTKPRGVIGYLVGYVATNIYRIWIPEIDRVITTRNVTFDEHTYYDPDEVASPLQVQQITRLTRALQDEDPELDVLVQQALWSSMEASLTPATPTTELTAELGGAHPPARALE